MRLARERVFPGGSEDKESACNGGDTGLIPGSGRSLGEENGSPLQYSGLENSMDCIVHGLAKSWTGLSDIHFHFTHTHKIYIYVRVFKQHAKLCFGLFFK